MKRSLLMVVLALPLALTGCDAAGPDSPSVATARHAPSSQLTDGSRSTSVLVQAAESPQHPGSPTVSDTPPSDQTLSKGSSTTDAVTYTEVQNPQPLAAPPADASTTQVGGGIGDPQGVPPPPCEPDVLDPGEPGYCEPGDGGGGGTGGGGTTPPAIYTRWYSRVLISGNTRANVISVSDAFDQNGQAKTIDYMSTSGYTTSNGYTIGGGQTGGPNISYAVVAGQIGRTSPGAINLCQYGSHRFRVLSITPAYDRTDPSSDCEYWQ